VKTVVEAHGI